MINQNRELKNILQNSISKGAQFVDMGFTKGQYFEISYHLGNAELLLDKLSIDQGVDIYRGLLDLFEVNDSGRGSYSCGFGDYQMNVLFYEDRDGVSRFRCALRICEAA